jgi:hypothetical protein
MIQGFSGGLLNRELIYQTDLPSFQRDFAALKTLDHGTGPAITFTRASGATYFDANGVLQTAANDEPRFDHDPATGESRGLLIEESRTNSLRNSQGGGAVVGAPGTNPTNWTTSATTGINREVVATGTLNGLAYIDLKFSGTNTSGSAGSIQVLFESVTQIVASTGQNWSASAYVALIAGGFSNITNERLVLTERSAAGAALQSHSAAITSAAATLQRYSISAALAEATTARVTSSIIGSVADGATIDITLRIAAPQLEQGAFATSYIPTTSAAATRAADSAIVTPINSFYNQVEGTLFGEARLARQASGFTPILFIGFGSSGSNVDIRYRATAATGFFVTVNSADQAVFNGGSAIAANAIARAIGAYKANDFAFTQNGETTQLDSSGTLPDPIQLCVGSDTGTFLNGHIRKLAYWPKRLSDTLLQQLTT